jgi:hypothetical protein
MSVEAQAKMLATQLGELLKSSQGQFLSLYYNHPGKFLFSNTFKTNALPCELGLRVGIVYLTICFINYS